MKRQILPSIALVALYCLLAGALSGCSWSIGSREPGSGAQPTRGQELIDLKKARDQGAISQ
ncbi:MAG TPA: hypothetical protein VL793_01515, partial [Patescibacteria group bacterium]|nr:hypothetical protein [Patescibacteria group bacterium]